LLTNGSRFEFIQPTVLWLTKPPSEYMKSGQMYYAFEMDEKMLPYVAEFVGAERLLFATDNNHSDSKFPHTVEEVMERKDLSDELKRKLMGENAARLYSLKKERVVAERDSLGGIEDFTPIENFPEELVSGFQTVRHLCWS